MTIKVDIGVVATKSLWSRLPRLIESMQPSETSITICAEEPSNLLQIPEQHLIWDSYIRTIRNALLANVAVLNNVPISEITNLSADHPLPDWMSFRQLKKSEISLYYKHMQIINNFLAGDRDYLLVLEDDVIIGKGFWKQLRLLASVDNIDYIDLAGGCSLSLQGKLAPALTLDESRVQLYNVPWRSGRTTCGYLLSRPCAYSFRHSAIEPYVLPIDWAFTLHFCHNRILDVCWAEGVKMLHGSQTGYYNSSIL